MASNRRDFIKATTAAAGAVALGVTSPVSATERRPAPIARVSNPLNILILGGTSFLGPHQIKYALERGHSVSIFTRGRTEPTWHKELFRDVEHLVGDRVDNLTALEGRAWDAVIDNSGRQVQWTRDTANLLAPNVDLYLYTSSTGVYYPYLTDDIGEDQEVVLAVPEGLGENEGAEYGYGVMKANSEIAAREAFGVDRAIAVRPSYMVGPADQTDRFPYWPVRLDRGGEVLVPGKHDDPVQYIDVRDVAEFMIRLIEDRNAGTYNAAGPASATGMHEFVYGASAAFSAPIEWVMIDDYDFLREHRVGWAIPWIMPVAGNYGSARINIDHAVASGMSFRPLADSCRDIRDWWYSDAVTEDRRQNMVSGARSLMAREPDIIAAWNTR